MGTRFLLLTSLVCILFCASCTTSNKIAYFQNAKDTTYRKMIGTIEAPLQSNDFISIAISSLSAEASEIFNPFVRDDANLNGGTGRTRGQQFVGYLINLEGYIEMPVLGKIMAAGLTKKELKEKITNSIISKKLLIEPLVDIRYLNFEITVLGEVTAPGVINVPNEKISLIKALSLVGDISIYGKKDNVLLIREEDGVRKTRHINLNSSDFLNSEYFYLKPNDVIYVGPNKARVAMTGRTQQILPILLTGLSFFFIIFDRVIR